jgi:hypothetical protein
MRRIVRWTLCLALLGACDAGEGAGPPGGLDGGADAGPGLLDAAPDGNAPDASAGRCVDQLCKDGVATSVSEVCFLEGYGQGTEASAAVYRVCLVDPSGTLYVTRLRGDYVLTTPGWTHSAYSTGLVRSTLSPADDARCFTLLWDGGDAGTGRCGQF